MRKRRCAALLLAFSLLLAIPVQAAGSLSHFTRQKTYTGQFRDLAADSVFYDNVSALYEYGLSIGKGDGTFGVKDPVTVGQVVIFAGRLRSTFRIGDAEQGARAFRKAGQPAYEAYLRYLKQEGVLSDELDGTYGQAATRAQVAHVLARTLPQGTLEPINEDAVTQGYATRRFIPDVTEYTDYFREILDLYRWGVSAGSDAVGTYYPNDPITRGALAAMLTRMVDPALRMHLRWDLEGGHSAAGATLAGLVPMGPYVKAPATRQELDSSLRNMLSSGKHTLTLRYDRPLTQKEAGQVMGAALNGVKVYCEQGYNAVLCTYDKQGKVRLDFSSVGAGEQTEAFRQSALDSAIEVHDTLWSEGVLTENMTEYEKARVYYNWVCSKAVYDLNAGEDSLSHIPYGYFTYGRAVCDGFTGAYNLLLKLEGISCRALANDEHIWTVAQLDGREYHIDTTWGASEQYVDQRFFGMSQAQSWQIHSW